LSTRVSLAGTLIGNAKWKHTKRYQALRNQVQALDAKAKTRRFRKEIDTRTFAYHVGWYVQAIFCRRRHQPRRRSPRSDPVSQPTAHLMGAVQQMAWSATFL
jgi:hypothetical protein